MREYSPGLSEKAEHLRKDAIMDALRVHSSTSSAQGAQHVSAVPERFRTTSNPVPGQSAVPQEFRGTSNPDVAKTTFTEVTPAEGEHSAERESQEQGTVSDDGA
jgi:hypothetical protein